MKKITEEGEGVLEEKQEIVGSKMEVKVRQLGYALIEIYTNSEFRVGLFDKLIYQALIFHYSLKKMFETFLGR